MEEKQNELRVMSFNIRTETARDIRYAWMLRKHLVTERIREFDPDLLGLQECQDGEQAEFIRAQFPDYRFLAVHRGDDTRNGREMAPLLYREGAFDLLDFGHFWISKTPDEPASKLFGAIFPRTVSWAQLCPRQYEGDSFYFFNTHFDYIPLVLSSSATILRERILAISGDAPVVLAGDFNTRRGGAAYRILTAPYSEQETAVPQPTLVLNDTGAATRSEGDEDGPGTLHKFGLISRPLIIDWILASQHFQVLESAVDDYSDNGLYPSDHYPVTAVLTPR